MKKILIVSTIIPDRTKLLKYLQDVEISEEDVIIVSAMAEAESIFFEVAFSLLILEWSLPGVPGFIHDLKADEMFRMLPVLTIIEKEDPSEVEKLFLQGVDNYAVKEQINDRLPLLIRPLIQNNVLNEELVVKVSQLQEKAIHDFILLDLIKKYIPLTIWDLANDYAYEQKIHIPEEELELTIAFGDIKEFTRMSEDLEPMEVIRSLNDVFEIITRIVYEHNGDIDKFIGDAFLGVFIEPEEAVKAMVKVQRELALLNNRRKEEELHLLEFRIGIHTGPVIRGNVGGAKRYDNTLIGDTVNTAARLEAASLPGDIMISEATRVKAGLDIHESKHLMVSLKGKAREMRVYQIYKDLQEIYQ